MKILVDGYGGDNAPSEIVKGVIDAVKAEKGFTVILSGKEDELKRELSQYSYDKTRVEILPANDVVLNEESPTAVIKSKPESSLVKGLYALKEQDDISAFISAGSTGALLAGATLLVGRIEGIKRPALAPLLPTLDSKKVMLIDCGANVDCKPDFLLQFAIMGSRYMTSMFGISQPRVGLLSNGTEDKKGNELAREAFKLLKQEPSINFCGNIEARDNLTGIVDVIVTDGFAGNIALKTSEGVSNLIFAALKQEIKKSFRAKIGTLFMMKSLRALKRRLDYNRAGGAPFLGIRKIVLKVHGSSKADAICSSVLQAKTMHDSNMIEKIKLSLKEQEV